MSWYGPTNFGRPVEFEGARIRRDDVSPSRSRKARHPPNEDIIPAVVEPGMSVDLKEVGLVTHIGRNHRPRPTRAPTVSVVDMQNAQSTNRPRCLGQPWGWYRTLIKNAQMKVTGMRSATHTVLHCPYQI